MEDYTKKESERLVCSKGNQQRIVPVSNAMLALEEWLATSLI